MVASARHVPSSWRQSAADHQRRCGYAFSYDEHCGRLVANAMQVMQAARTAFINKLENKLPSIEVRLTALAEPFALTLICDIDLQSPASCVHDLLMCNSSRSAVSRFKR